MRLRRMLLLLAAAVFVATLHAQVGISQPSDEPVSAAAVSARYIASVTSTTTQLSQKLDKQAERSLAKFQRQETRIQRKLAKKDSTKAAAMVSSASQQYAQLKQRLGSVSPGQYIPSLDTLGTSLQFLKQNSKLLAKTKDSEKKLADAIGKVTGLQDRFKKAEEIKKFLKERRQYLQEQLGQLGFAKELKQVNKQVYYYSERLNEYKALLKDHKKAEKKALELLSHTKLFKDFMRRHSQLASLFRLPSDPADPSLQVGLAGLQTRAQVNNLIQQQLAAGGAAAQEQFRENLQQAQDQIKQLKNKIIQSGRGSSDAEMPEGFKPNNQKTKNFLQRLELGINVQSQKARGFFPTTSDIGLSVGYKLNNKSVIGIGGSYKLGWGRDIRHINITHQGIGLRSFVDWKIRGSFWLSGGYEMNYRSEFRNIDELKKLSAWQQSGLVGVSKVVSLKTNFFRKTKLQLLWDFLSYRQVPQAQPLLFRIGYNF